MVSYVLKRTSFWVKFIVLQTKLREKGPKNPEIVPKILFGNLQSTFAVCVELSTVLSRLFLLKIIEIFGVKTAYLKCFHQNHHQYLKEEKHTYSSTQTNTEPA